MLKKPSGSGIGQLIFLNEDTDSPGNHYLEHGSDNSIAWYTHSELETEGEDGAGEKKKIMRERGRLRDIHLLGYFVKSPWQLWLGKASGRNKDLNTELQHSWENALICCFP